MQFFQRAFSQLPTLSTKRLILRPIRMTDAEDMFQYASDPAVSRYVLWDTHQSIRQTKQFIRAAIHQYKAGDPASFAIESREDGKMIGTVGFMWVNTDNKSAEVGYSLSRAYWNKGLMTEALQMVIAYGFDTLRLNRIEAQHDIQNPASGRVMQHVGMKYEGMMRQRIYNKTHFVDVALYAILRSDKR